MRYKKIYCVYCGEKNTSKDSKCKKCKKKLNPKENMLLDYIKDHIKGDIEGNIISIVKNLIISHLYGTVLTATLIFTVVSAIVTTVNDDKEFIKVEEKPTVLINNLNKCVFVNSKEAINICNEGYLLDGDICRKEEQQDAMVNYVCPNGYTASGNLCVSNDNFSMLTKEECIAPEGENVVGAHVENGTCWVEYCSGWTDGVCSAGSMEPIDFTITSYCPPGTTLINGVCKKTANYNISYSCEEGTLSENKCLIIKEEVTHLGCEEGYILNQECNLCILGE